MLSLRSAGPVSSRLSAWFAREMCLGVPTCFVLAGLMIVSTTPSFAQEANEAEIAQRLRQHEYAGALLLANQFLAQHPQDAKLWLFRGLALHGQAQDELSLNSLHHALQVSPDFLQAAEAGAQIAYGARTADESYFLNQVLRLDPSNTTAHAMEGVLALEQHNCAKALQHFSAAKNLRDQDPDTARKLAACRADAGDPQGALAELKILHGKYPQDSKIAITLAEEQFAAHQYGEAIVLLAPLSPGLPPNGLAVLAAAYAATDDVSNAVATYRSAIEQDPKNDRNYLDLAILSMDHQSPEVALGVLDAGLRNLPTSSRLLVMRGSVYAQIGKNELAQADFEQADRFDPKSTYGTLGLGVLFREQSNLDEAQKVCERKLAQSPQNAVLNFMLADILIRKGADPGDPNFSSALILLHGAVQRQPDLAQAHALLGKLELKQGHNEAAVRELEIAIQTQSHDRTALNQLVAAYRRLGRTADAERVAAVLAQSVAQERAGETEKNRIHLTLDEQKTAQGGAPSETPKP